MGKVCVYRVLFACVCVCVCVCVFVCWFVRLRITTATIKLPASNFARWFMGVLGRESPILGNFAPPNPKSDESELGEVLLIHASPLH